MTYLDSGATSFPKPQSVTNAVIACCIFFVLWLLYTVFLFRRKIFKKKYQDNPVTVWKDEE